MASVTVILISLISLLTAGAFERTENSHVKVKRSDDMTPIEFNAIIQQQAATIETLQSQLSVLSEKVTGLTQGLSNVEQTLTGKTSALEDRLSSVEQDARKQVAFHVHFSASWNEPVTLDMHSVLKFDAVVTNVKGGYSRDTGVFTAPVNGTYLFLLTAVAKDHYTELDIRVTGGGIVAMTGGYYDQGETSAGTHRDTAHAAVSLRKGEQAWVQHNGHGSTVIPYWYTTFTGALLQAE